MIIFSDSIFGMNFELNHDKTLPKNVIADFSVLLFNGCDLFFIAESNNALHFIVIDKSRNEHTCEKRRHKKYQNDAHTQKRFLLLSKT